MALKINKLTKHAGWKTILHTTNLTFEPETIYGLLGRNGAGKSTLLNIIADRIPANTGQITLDGKHAHENDQVLQRIFLASEDNLYPVREHVSQLFDSIKKMYGSFDMENAHRLTAAFELNEKTAFGRLSTGYRTIFKDIVALCVPADYILLDEPVLGLDAGHRDLFYKELITTFANRPRTFIIATHLIEEVESLLNNVVVIDEGQVKLAEPVDQLMERSYRLVGPADDMTAFLKDVQVLSQETFANETRAIVTMIGTPEMPNTIKKQALNLQDLFVALTEGHHEN
ncbi:MAG TPA: ABC transporter ATP-binding protein [Lactobacillus sp.]|nr:ABC transporter ATP-binding protein [Lactobacillus sp.]